MARLAFIAVILAWTNSALVGQDVNRTTVLVFPVDLLGRPVSLAQITLEKIGQPGFRTKQTANEFSDVPFGLYRVRVESDGFRVFDKEISIQQYPHHAVVAGLRLQPLEGAEMDLSRVTVSVPMVNATAASVTKLALLSPFSDFAYSVEVSLNQ